MASVTPSTAENIYSFDIDFCKGLIERHFEHQLEVPTGDLIELAEKKLHFTFGEQMRWLLTNYGSVACGSVETLCLLNKLKLKSSLVRDTLRFRQFDEMPENLVAFYKSSDCFIFCCDEKDRVFVYSIWGQELTPYNTTVIPFLIRESLESLLRLTSPSREEVEERGYLFSDERLNCPLRNATGNCTCTHEFCPCVSDSICDGIRKAYEAGKLAAQNSPKNNLQKHQSLSGIKLIEFNDTLNREFVAVFDEEKISEKDVVKFITNDFGMFENPLVSVMTKTTWENVFGKYSAIQERGVRQ